MLEWLRRRPYYAAAAAGAAWTAVVLAVAKASSSVVPSQAMQEADKGFGVQLLGPSLTAKPGKTYRATIVTHGAANAASATTVAAHAMGMGFGPSVDVSASMPAEWPSAVTGDWYITAPFNGKVPLVVARNNGSWIAGADVVDVWEA
jgi:hypothetical protein